MSDTLPQPKRPNAEGETMCGVRWMVELPSWRWIGAWDREAFDEYAAAAVAAERERCADLCWDRRGHFASDAAARAFAELVRNGTPGADGV